MTGSVRHNKKVILFLTHYMISHIPDFQSKTIR